VLYEKNKAIQNYLSELTLSPLSRIVGEYEEYNLIWKKEIGKNEILNFGNYIVLKKGIDYMLIDPKTQKETDFKLSNPPDYMFIKNKVFGDYTIASGKILDLKTLSDTGAIKFVDIKGDVIDIAYRKNNDIYLLIRMDGKRSRDVYRFNNGELTLYQSNPGSVNAMVIVEGRGSLTSP
jgi:hypothetical protein